MPLLAPALEVLLSCLFAVARHLGSQSAAAFGHSQTVEAASFRRALFMPGADDFLSLPKPRWRTNAPTHGQQNKTRHSEASMSIH